MRKIIVSIILLLSTTHLLLAQMLSSKTAELHLRSRTANSPVLDFPVIKWKSQRNVGSTEFQHVEIVFSVASNTVMKSIGLSVRGAGPEQISGPGRSGTSDYKHTIELMPGDNWIEIIAENVAGGKTSFVRYIEAATDDYVVIHGTPATTPLLVVEAESASFKDSNGNGKLDGNEDAVVEFAVVNQGKGRASNLVINHTLSGDKEHIIIKSDSIKSIAPSGRHVVTVNVSGTEALLSGNAGLKLIVAEPNGFDSTPIEVAFETVAFAAPDVQVIDGLFSSINAGRLKPNNPASLQVLIKNNGKGIAEKVVLTIVLPENVLNLEEQKIDVGRLLPDEARKIDMEFVVNSRYAKQEVPVTIVLAEKLAKYGSERTFTATLDQPLASAQLNVKGETLMPDGNVGLLRSAVDINIPETTAKNPNRYAIVIGNEDYSQFQPGLEREQNVAFARNDAMVFRDYLVSTLGCPANQVYLLTDATKGQMNRELERVKELVMLNPQSELIFYYAGHGLPDFETRKGYIIPVDISGANIRDGISLADLYTQLASTKASKITVFLDACFSGGGRGENGLLAARTVRVKPTGDLVDGNIIVYTATSGEEVSLPIRRESHGLFTYYLLKKFQASQGKFTMQELKDYLEKEIPKSSLIENGMKQTPQLLTSPKLENNWELWKF